MVKHIFKLVQMIGNFLRPCVLGCLILLTFLGLSGSLAAFAADSCLPCGDKVMRGTELRQRIKRDGRARVIVRMEVPQYKSLRKASARDAGPTSRAMSPDSSLKAAIRGRSNAVKNALANTNGRVKHTFSYLPSVLVEVDEKALDRLAGLDWVTSIQEDELVPLNQGAMTPAQQRTTSNQSLLLVGADKVWDAGYTGKGQTVAIVDTGVLSNHVDFGGASSRVVAEACFSSDFSNWGSEAICPNGASEAIGPGTGGPATKGSFIASHGTHVAGIAAGSPPADVAASGVAPEADIISVQVFSYFAVYDDVMSWNSDQIKGLEHVYSLRNTYDIAVVNFSIGSRKKTAYCPSDGRASIIGLLREAGIATIVASGNDGYTTGVGEPACVEAAISVDATDHNDDEYAWGNWGPGLVDLMAPGVDVYSAFATNTTSFGNKTGTSMAAPHVAGAFALLRQARPNASVTEIEQALKATGIMPTMKSGTETPTPRIRIDLALEKLPGSSITPALNLLLLN